MHARMRVNYTKWKTYACILTIKLFAVHIYCLGEMYGQRFVQSKAGIYICRTEKLRCFRC